MSSLLQLSLAYLIWHYSAAWGDLWRFHGNLAWFLGNFFSLELLFGTLFAPWKRLREHAKRRGDGGVVGRFIINFMTRLVGFSLRSLTILSGLASISLLCALTILTFVAWLTLPLVALGLVLWGAAALLAFMITG